MSVRKIVKRLRKTGLVRIGEGSFGVAVAPESREYVYKIGSINNLLDGWYYFGQLAMLHSDNPYFPKIEKLQGTSQAYVAKMEYIPSEVTTSASIKWELGDYIKNWLSPTDEYSTEWYKKDSDFIKSFPFTADPLFCDALSIMSFYLEDIKRELGINIYFDIHEGNFRCREDGQLVIIDPFAIEETDSYSGMSESWFWA